MTTPSDKPVKVEASRRPAGTAPEGTFLPVVDIQENDGEVVLVAEVPGADRDDVSVQVDRGVLTVEANARVEVPGEGYTPTFVGFVPGRYFRAFAISDEIDREKIAATVSRGVLTVRLPKAASARSRKIPIKSGD